MQDFFYDLGDFAFFHRARFPEPLFLATLSAVLILCGYNWM
jgi:hypothetical protein